MKFRFALACWTAIVTQAWAASPALVPIEAFVERETFSQPRISPDGQHIAVNVRIMRNGRMIPTMTVFKLPSLDPVSRIALQGFEVPVNFLWLTNRRLIVRKGLEIGERERPVATGELVTVDLDGKNQQYLYGYKARAQSSRGERYGNDYGYGIINHIPMARDGHVQVSAHLFDGNHSFLYDINTTNAIRKLLADISEPDVSFLSDRHDEPRFAFGLDEQADPTLFRRDLATGKWNKLDQKNLGSRFVPIAFSTDNASFLALQHVNDGPAILVREEVATGKRTTLVEDPFASVSGIHYTSARIPFAVSKSVGIPTLTYLDPASPEAALHKTLSASFPGAYVNFINFSDDGQALLFSVSSDRDPGSFYVFDKRTGKADLLFSNMEKIDPARMAPRVPIRFTARDGLEIAGYLTLPKAEPGKKLPMVLLPHGGPFDVEDDWFFDTDAQFLASRGYAVLQVNFRGSGGRSLSFEKAGYREYGGKIMDDLIDGVKWAATRPDIDSSRVCVYGGSFGGYAAMMLPIREPSMFKCSVGFAGRYDLPSRFKQDSMVGDKMGKNYITRTMGNDPAMLAKYSPTQHADKIKIPVLLVHGKKDKTTQLDQAEMMRDALIKAGNAPEWMLDDIEGHGFYDTENRKRFYEKLEGFLAKHIGN
ncbi:alpha/beta hydrolase family protein [Massilia soli]|uniref:S9 family peptidase n=1 Tax=Massilia soli TaxID=2792854 RepID=A0ABS7SPV8_9BURK|nr:S9 family peptidase [Massilia soli]MBZ2208207.1 S9 family peptidase [Massilia soli]